jgi:hypothetical protein
MHLREGRACLTSRILSGADGDWHGLQMFVAHFGECGKTKDAGMRIEISLDGRLMRSRESSDLGRGAMAKCEAESGSDRGANGPKA